MAYLAASAIQTRIREVIESAAGSLRTISAGSYLGDAPEGEGDMERARAAILGAKVEALCTSFSRSASNPPTLGNVALYDSEWRVRVTRILDRTAQIDDSTRDAVKSLAFRDADVLSQALGFPNNLATTAAGTATGIVSGLMTYRGSSSSVRGPVDDGASIIETDHRFTAILRSTPAVS
jgi:hypothetical protein